MKIVDNSIKYIQFLLQDRLCRLCDTINQHQDSAICTTCINELPYINQACSRCALPMSNTNSPVCGHCLSLPPSYDVLLSPFEYRFPIDTFITELKFNQKLYNRQILGKLFSEFITARKTPLPECIIPVPLHPKRLQQRGYNQSLEIARIVSKNLDIPIERHWCERVKNTEPQSGLNAENRQHNIKNAFNIKKQQQYTHVAIFDDVVTTGHTIEALSKLLRHENVNIIQVWSIARVYNV